MSAVKHLFYRFWYGTAKWGVNKFEFGYMWFSDCENQKQNGLERAHITLFHRSLIYTRQWDKAIHGIGAKDE